MQVIYTCLVILMFITGTGFGYVIGKNGYVQIGGKTEKAEKPVKKTVEQQLDEMMNYDGKKDRDRRWTE